MRQSIWRKSEEELYDNVSHNLPFEENSWQVKIAELHSSVHHDVMRAKIGSELQENFRCEACGEIISTKLDQISQSGIQFSIGCVLGQQFPFIVLFLNII